MAQYIKHNRYMISTKCNETNLRKLWKNKSQNYN